MRLRICKEIEGKFFNLIYIISLYRKVSKKKFVHRYHYLRILEKILVFIMCIAQIVSKNPVLLIMNNHEHITEKAEMLTLQTQRVFTTALSD